MMSDSKRCLSIHDTLVNTQDVSEIIKGSKNVCVGMGFVVLDAIYRKHDQPDFLAGGSCGNVLTILSYLGWDSYPVVRLGKDVEGDRIIEDMKRWKVKTKFIEQEKGSASPIIIQKLSPRKKLGYRFYSKCEDGTWLPGWRTFLLKSLEAIQDKVPKANVFYFDRVSPSALEMARNQKKQGAIIFFEPTQILWDDKEFLKCLQISDIVKYSYNPKVPVNRSILKDVPIEIQTMGKDGIRYRSKLLKQRTWEKLNAFPISNLVDDAGSGDWVSAALISTLGRYKLSDIRYTAIEEALGFGQLLAYLNCQFVGARGMMYSLPLLRIFSLIRRAYYGRTVQVGVPDRGPRKTILAKKCRVCSGSKARRNK